MNKKFFVMAILSAMSLLAIAGEKITDVFTLDHQMSKMCEKKIKENLPYEKGVKDLVVSLSDNTITITYDSEKSNPEQLIKAFKKIGFNAERLTPAEEPCDSISE